MVNRDPDTLQSSLCVCPLTQSQAGMVGPWQVRDTRPETRNTGPETGDTGPETR